MSPRKFREEAALDVSLRSPRATPLLVGTCESIERSPSLRGPLHPTALSSTPAVIRIAMRALNDSIWERRPTRVSESMRNNPHDRKRLQQTAPAERRPERSSSREEATMPRKIYI